MIDALSLEGNVFLGPIAGYSDRSFRSICIEQGANFTFTELISSEALVRNGVKSAVLLRRGDNEKQYGIQLFGADPVVMYKAAALLAPYHPEAVDINAGCPVPKVVKTGAGSGLMRNPPLLGQIVAAVVKSSQDHLGSVPVTIKLRSGWDEGSINYYECSRIAADAGAALVSLHARTRTQGYGGKSDWSHIKDLVSRITLPVIGSGDLFTPEDAENMLRETRCAAVMFARGAIGNPFIFSMTRSLLLTGAYILPDPSERLKTGFRQLRLLAEDAGETIACREMRKQFCAYTRGMPGGAPLRNRLVHAETIEAYRQILDQYGLDLSGKNPANS
jgi:nifR3 family TIM-barrel protein